MHCVTCQETAEVDKSINNKNVYIAGTDKLKSDSVEYHELSINHQKAMKIVAGRNKSNETPAMKMIYGLNNTTNKLKHLFRTAHYISVQCRPVSDYVSLSKLDKAMSVDIGDSYLIRKSATMFIDSIAQVERQKLYNDVSRSSFISVISDCSTDNS